MAATSNSELYEAKVRIPDPIALYDGVCGLCHRAVRAMLHIDTYGIFHFAPLQGETAAVLRQRHPEIPGDLDTMVVIDGGRVYLRAQAVMQAARYARMPWRILSWFRWLPGFIANPVYRLVAALRYRLFGKLDTCALPAPEQRARFLD